MTIDENRAREVYKRIERETGVMPPEGSAMQEAVIRAMLALATEAAQPDGWVPSGWKLVPVKLTMEMRIASSWEMLNKDWAAILAASPPPPSHLRADASQGKSL